MWFWVDIFTAIALATFISCHYFVADKLTVWNDFIKANNAFETKQYAENEKPSKRTNRLTWKKRLCSIESWSYETGVREPIPTKRVKKSNHCPTMAVITEKYCTGWWKLWLLIKVDTEMRSEFKNLHLYGHGSILTFSIKWSTMFQFRLTRMRRLNESVHDYVIVRKKSEL